MRELSRAWLLLRVDAPLWGGPPTHPVRLGRVAAAPAGRIAGRGIVDALALALHVAGLLQGPVLLAQPLPHLRSPRYFVKAGTRVA